MSEPKIVGRIIDRPGLIVNCPQCPGVLMLSREQSIGEQPIRCDCGYTGTHDMRDTLWEKRA